MRVQLIAFLFLVYGCGEQQQKVQSHQTEPVSRNVNNEPPALPREEKGISFHVVPVEEKIKSKISGTISANSPRFEPGTTVKKGQLLLLFDNTNAFLEIQTLKKQFKSDLLQIRAASEDSVAFNAFQNQITPNAVLPEFPHFSLTTLKRLNQHQLLDQYDVIAHKEASMLDYFVFAPVGGNLSFTPKKDSYKQTDLLFVVNDNRYQTSKPVPGRKKQHIQFKDEANNEVDAVIVEQLKNETILRGKLNKNSTYTINQ